MPLPAEARPCFSVQKYLVLDGGDGFEKYRGVSEIKGWLMNR